MKIVAYYRVSTDRQGRSGLGLAAQRDDVARFAAQHAGSVIEAFTEVETGRRADRPELARALALARAMRATLVVAKLDRLARNVAFLSALMAAGCDFVAVDNPHANKLTLHILAAVAEDELDRMSARIKAALAQAKLRGVKLGRQDPRCVGRGFDRISDAERRVVLAAATATHAKRAAEFRAAVRPLAAELLAGGMTNAQAAAELNRRGFRTRKGKPWTLFTVSRLINQS